MAFSRIYFSRTAKKTNKMKTTIIVATIIMTTTTRTAAAAAVVVMTVFLRINQLSPIKALPGTLENEAFRIGLFHLYIILLRNTITPLYYTIR
jgi:hypothetical protein